MSSSQGYVWKCAGILSLYLLGRNSEFVLSQFAVHDFEVNDVWQVKEIVSDPKYHFDRIEDPNLGSNKSVWIHCDCSSTLNWKAS